jgi:hypothetical protein
MLHILLLLLHHVAVYGITPCCCAPVRCPVVYVHLIANMTLTLIDCSYYTWWLVEEAYECGTYYEEAYSIYTASIQLSRTASTPYQGHQAAAVNKQEDGF